MENNRIETVSASLEEQFHTCRRETEAFLSGIKERRNGKLSSDYVDEFLKLVRANVLLAGMIARLDGVKNRNSKTQ